MQLNLYMDGRCKLAAARASQKCGHVQSIAALIACSWVAAVVTQ